MSKHLYEAAFKRRHSGRLWWVRGFFLSENEAITKLQERVQVGLKGWNLYGGPFPVTKQTVIS